MAGKLFFNGAQSRADLLFDIQFHSREIVVTTLEEAVLGNHSLSSSTKTGETKDLKGPETHGNSIPAVLQNLAGLPSQPTTSSDGNAERIGAVTGMPVSSAVSMTFKPTREGGFHPGHPITVRYRDRKMVSGEVLSEKFKGRFFAPISTCYLSMDDSGFPPESWFGSVISIPCDADGALYAPAPIRNLAAAQGVPARRYHESLGLMGTLVYVSRENMKSIDEGDFAFFAENDRMSFVSNRKDWEKVSEPSKMIGLMRTNLPTFKLSGAGTLEAEKRGELAVELVRGTGGRDVPYNGSLRVTPVAGYFPKTVIPVKNGRASIPVMALGLSPGDDLHFWLGFQSNDYLSEHKLKIV